MAKATVKENAFFKSSSDFYMLNSTNIQEKQSFPICPRSNVKKLQQVTRKRRKALPSTHPAVRSLSTQRAPGAEPEVSASPLRSPADAPAGDGSAAGPKELQGTPASDSPSPACARSPVPPERQVLLLLPRLLHPRAAFSLGCSAPPAPRASPGGAAPGAPAALSSLPTCCYRRKSGARGREAVPGGDTGCGSVVPFNSFPSPPEGSPEHRWGAVEG
ncbi:uncharacterized protein LOC116216845 [Meleagris gallopavo]|uniref:uncharacterized protein LOC116216845 n=1 Tax=Meleagris gallopavo TaxID=9103 RepID=UPI0012ABFD8C|nr:uncharacterized protein LOC116216845 [Meleagris gallopavo]